MQCEGIWHPTEKVPGVVFRATKDIAKDAELVSDYGSQCVPPPLVSPVCGYSTQCRMKLFDPSERSNPKHEIKVYPVHAISSHPFDQSQHDLSETRLPDARFKPRVRC